MAYVVGIFALLLFIALMIHSAGFRWVIGVLVVLAGLGGWYAFEESVKNDARRKAEQARKASAIPPTQLRMDAPMVYGGELALPSFRTRLFNNSAYDLDEVGIKLTYRDCIDERCVVIGEDVLALRDDVPAGQARDVQATVYNWPRNLQGILSWNYAIVSTQAK